MLNKLQWSSKPCQGNLGKEIDKASPLLRNWTDLQTETRTFPWILTPDLACHLGPAFLARRVSLQTHSDALP